MGRNVLNARFGARKGDYVSSVWRLWATKHGDIYLTDVGGAPDKYSFHSSGKCRTAFTKESGRRPKGQSDRVVEKWVRASPPEAGKNQIVPLIYLQIPTDFLSREKNPYRKKVDWVVNSRESSSVLFLLFLTNETKSEILTTLKDVEVPNALMNFASFSSGMSVGLVNFIRDWENVEMTIDGKGRVNDILISHLDPLNVGRPIRIFQRKMVGDEEPYVPWVTEQGAYAIEGNLPQKKENDDWVNFHNPPDR